MTNLMSLISFVSTFAVSLVRIYVMHFAASGAEALDRLLGEIQPTLVAVLSDINLHSESPPARVRARGMTKRQDGGRLMMARAPPVTP
jgi:CheY-like chemotaxis protein